MTVESMKKIFEHYVECNPYEVQEKIYNIFGAAKNGESSEGVINVSVDNILGVIHINYVRSFVPGWFRNHWKEMKETIKNYGFYKITLCDRCGNHAYDYWGERGFDGEHLDNERTLYL